MAEKTRREQLDEILKYAADRNIPVPADTLLEIAKQDAEALVSDNTRAWDIAIQKLQSQVQTIEALPELWPADKLDGVIPYKQLPIFTLKRPGAVPAAEDENYWLAGSGWRRLPKQAVTYIGGGAATPLTPNLIALGNLPNGVGWLHNDGTGILSWTIPAGGGNVFGAAPTVVNNFAAFDNLTGTLIKDSGFNSGSFDPAGAAAGITLAGLGGQPLNTILTTFSGLANAAGMLTNNGAGVLAWTAIPATHAPVTLDANADTLLSLSTQTLGLDTQTAGMVFAGPAIGVAAVPTFRALVATDIPALSYAPVTHDILSASHGDTLTGAVVDGSIIIGNVTPKWSTLAISIPAANVRNVLGVDNGELRPSWKAALDATNPATLTAAGAAAPGTSLIFAHRDHVHAITGAPGLLGNGAMQYQTIITGVAPFAPVYSGFLLDGTTGGKTVFAVTNTKTLTLTSTGDFNATFPATGTVAMLNQANSFTLINPLTTITESWIGPSAINGIYFKGGNVGFGTITPNRKVTIASGNIEFDSIAYPGAPTPALAGSGAGNLNNGVYIYGVAFVTANGNYTTVGLTSATVTVVDKTTNGKVQLSNIPTSIDPLVTQRRLYRTLVNGDPWNIYYLDFINDNVTTTYLDNIADTSLTLYSGYQDNTTAGIIYNGTVRVFNANIYNTTVGYQAGNSLTAGGLNVFVGAQAGKVATTGILNVFIGAGAGALCTTGQYNTAINSALPALVSGNGNVAIGLYSGNGTLGDNNTFVGYQSGGLASANVAVGYYAGRYETVNNKLFLDNRNRTNEANGRAQSIIYGVMASTPAAQALTVNAALNVTPQFTAAGINTVQTIDAQGSGANNDGGALSFLGKTSTTASQAMGLDQWLWVNATHANRKARRVFNVYDTAVREAFRIEASGAAPMIGFLGAAAVVRPSAWTQTYATASKTVPNMTYAAPAGGLVIDVEGRASLAQLAADVLAYLKNITALIDDAQSLGLTG